MASLTRRMQRKPQRSAGTFNAGTTPFRVDPTGYSALHPTKGWKHISYARLRAQRRMAAMLGA